MRVLRDLSWVSCTLPKVSFLILFVSSNGYVIY